MSTALFLDRLFTPQPPWIFRHCRPNLERKVIESHYYNPKELDAEIRVLRGARMTQVGGLMQEFAAAFQFFEGFGENWYALEECLQYLDEWLSASAYIVVVTRPELMLSEEPTSETDTLLKVLRTVGEWWAHPITNNDRFNRGPVPFHTVLEFSLTDLRKAPRLGGLPPLETTEAQRRGSR